MCWMLKYCRTLLKCDALFVGRVVIVWNVHMEVHWLFNVHENWHKWGTFKSQSEANLAFIWQVFWGSTFYVVRMLVEHSCFFIGVCLYLIMPCRSGVRRPLDSEKLIFLLNYRLFEEFIWDVTLGSLLKVGPCTSYHRRLKSILWEPWILHIGILIIDIMIRRLNGHLQ
jgi:hypothetical protein